LTAVPAEPSPPPPQLIVGAAIIADGRVLACERADPPEMAGRWEFPGGKVEAGENDAEALIRECEEELGVRVRIGAQVGGDIPIANGRAILRVYAASITDDALPRPIEHAALRWLGPDELYDVAWLPADAPIVSALPPLLTAGPTGARR
jgi:8-oxo-dGTP diphosphatase